MYEGAPNYPEPDRFWSIIEKYRVSIFYQRPQPSAHLRNGVTSARKARPVQLGDCWERLASRSTPKPDVV
jgi:acyl-coenzyme A synthetase/AMP-(fatty) acid ligase